MGRFAIHVFESDDAPMEIVAILPDPIFARRAPSPGVRLVTVIVAILAIAVPALVVRYAPHAHFPRRHNAAAHHVVPRAQIPAVEPVAFEDLDPAAARRFNAQIPFTADPVPAARPFLLRDSLFDTARAVDCLAAAVLYEAGDDLRGQRAVAQVVLNRVRHPAFPKSVCGVVFQGAERSTGCQFTFTCDGAIVRHAWSVEAWTRARGVAIAALNGAVFSPVGYSTHYHTDWVVPYWSASLDKVNSVGTHLFFRWSGWWGTPGAFQRSVSGQEPVIAALAAYSPAHRPDTALSDLMSPEQRLAAINAATIALPPPVAGAPDSFLVSVDPNLPPEDLAGLAVHSCGTRPYCKFMAWTNSAQTPKRLPLGTAQISTMAFSYLRDHEHNFDKMLWNCRFYARVPKSNCMKSQLMEGGWAAAQAMTAADALVPEQSTQGNSTLP
ncbi:MAG: cell wall hydrolase [Sphingomonas sp.]|jgi:spore germination cell wall hydrolase CwlJ-like protein